MQQSMPAHLKRYESSGAYMPPHIQKAMTQHMQKSLPAHMRQYASPYMEQHVVSQNPTISASPAAAASPSFTPRAPSAIPQTGFPAGSIQQPAQAASYVQQPYTSSAPPLQPQATPSEPAPTGPHPGNYDFIMNPGSAAQPKSSLPGANSMLMRVAVVSVIIIVLLVGFSFVKSLLSGSTDLTPYVTVAQDQQALIHLTTNALTQPDISATNKTFSATTQLTVTSSQSQLFKYLTNNKKKLASKQLNLKVSSATDTQLATAESATTFNTTYKQVMQTELNTYMNDLKAAYQQSSGKKGRALLSSDFDQAQLLANQLNVSN